MSYDGKLSHFTRFKALWGTISRGLQWSRVRMNETFELNVHLACDTETGRWYVADSDIPGLWLEADDPLTLIERLKEAAPEMIALNEAEILASCRAKMKQANPARIAMDHPRPTIRPIFDSPLQLAY
jgi:hypothetical protein